MIAISYVWPLNDILCCCVGGIPLLRMIFNKNISYITQNMVAITYAWTLKDIANSCVTSFSIFHDIPLLRMILTP